MSLPACALLMSPEDQFSPAIHSREIALRLTKQYSKLWGACAERGPLDLLKAAGWSSEGLRAWGRLPRRDITLQEMEKKKEGFPGKVSFSFHSRATSACQPALLPTFIHCWSALLAVPGHRVCRKPGPRVFWWGSLETGLGNGKKWG